MKKEDKLLAIANYAIEHPKLNISVQTPVNTITIREDQIFYGELYVENYSQYSDLIYVELLKEYIQLRPNPDNASNYLIYQIDGTNLVPGYMYEDEMSIYYPGGVLCVEFHITLVSNDDHLNPVPNIEQSVIELKAHANPMSRQRDRKEEVVNIFFEKKTYSLEDAIELKLYNYSDEIKSIIIETTHDLIHPKDTEFFLRDEWTQEWYIQQSTWAKIVGRAIFRETPFEELVFNIRVDAGVNRTRQRTIQTILTAYPPYLTPYVISDAKAYRSYCLQCLNKYVLFLLGRLDKKAMIQLTDLIKACLNFNQLNFEIRMLYLWILVDTGNIRSYEQEAKFIRKYHDYYHEKESYPIFIAFEKIIKQKISKRHFSSKELSAQEHWLLKLIQARYMDKSLDRYKVYYNLYKLNVRHGFLFAETVRFLNKNDVPMETDDQFYAVCVQWALNKSCLSKHWAHNIIHRKKTWVRKNPYITSWLLMQIYKEYPSIDLMQICCEKAIFENRKDDLALEFYKIGLAEGRYIKDLDRIYVETVTALEEHVDFALLKYMNFTKDLSIKSKGYIYKKMIEADIMDYSRFSRTYQELMTYIQSISQEVEYVQTLIELLNLLKERIIQDHFEVVNNILDTRLLTYMKESIEGRSFLKFLLEYIIERISTPPYDEFFFKLERTLKPEGIILLSEKTKSWYEETSRKPKVFLDNVSYKALLVHDKSLATFLRKLLIESSGQTLLEEYQELRKEEQNKVRHLLCEVICRRILIDEMTPTDADKSFLQDCYQQGTNHKKGLLLTLQKIFSYHSGIEEIKKRDIIIPWTFKNSGKTLETSIQYYGEPSDKLLINYRYEEDEVFQSDDMIHLAYGMFVYPIYVFYGEYIEYYIIKKETGKEDEVVVSDLIHKQTAEEHLDFIAFALEVGDSKGTDALIDEYEQHLKHIGDLNHI